MNPGPKPPTAPSRPMPSPVTGGPAATSFEVTRGRVQGVGERVILYGTGGIGKSTLAALIEGVIDKPVVFLD